MLFMLLSGNQLSWWKKISGNKTTILICIRYILYAIICKLDIFVKVLLVVIFILLLVSSLKCWECAEGSCVLDQSGGNMGIEEICTSTAPVCAKQEFGKNYNKHFCHPFYNFAGTDRHRFTLHITISDFDGTIGTKRGCRASTPNTPVDDSYDLCLEVLGKQICYCSRDLCNSANKFSRPRMLLINLLWTLIVFILNKSFNVNK